MSPNFNQPPIDLMPFIGASQDPERNKKKLEKLYNADLAKALQNNDTVRYEEILKKIKELNGEKTEEENKSNN
jgi:hypothetical protein